jgi:hypothetical protein
MPTRSARSIIALLICQGVLLSQLSAIPITNKAGKTIEVELLQIESDRIQIRMQNGQDTWFDRALLSDASQNSIEQTTESDQNQFESINEFLGIALFSDNHLWDDTPDNVAERLDWPRESKTKLQASFRYYPEAADRILKARPYSAALYGTNKSTELISIVFANKGDFKFSSLPTSREITEMGTAIRTDADTISDALTEQLGEPQKQQFGAGRGIKQLIQRWDWSGHAFLLASQDGEYVSLKIMPTDLADNKGRGEKYSDSDLRELTTGNLIQRENGDVLIGNIPMVDQGPKGYCVPATFERYLRYMQLPADMYILAMAGQTEIGGGTSIFSIIESIESYIASQSRSMKELNEPIKVNTVQKYIDKGLPIMWTLFSSDPYNKYANSRTIARRKVTDWEAWAKQTKTDSRKIEIRKDFLSAHICMIIGYNKDTDEIAVSDSWGPAYAERWISAEQAEQVSQGAIYLISF